MHQYNQLFPTINTIKSSGILKHQAQDFKVTEKHHVLFTNQGEHLWLRVRKINSNTAWVATQIASACKVPARQVGFAGQKDRYAVTEQWFSVQLPKIDDIDTINDKLPKEVKIIKHHWHQSKIKRGQLSGNEFQIKIRHVKGNRSQVEQNITQVSLVGAPNYFGPQRFGHDMGNIQKVQDWFAGKTKVNNKNLRSLLISTARSHIFNLIIAERISNGIWNQVIKGDIMQLDGSHSWFPAENATAEELEVRLAKFDIHISASMWGEDSVQSSNDCAKLEQKIANSLPDYHQGFEKFRVKQDRRAIRIKPTSLNYAWDGNHLLLSFILPPGCFATSVLREIINCEQVEHNRP